MGEQAKILRTCKTKRLGFPCRFQLVEECSWRTTGCTAVVVQCKGCKNIGQYKDMSYCNEYPFPEMKWRDNKECPKCSKG